MEGQVGIKLGEPGQGVKALIYERKRKGILPHYFIKVAISRHQRTCLSFFRMSPGTSPCGYRGLNDSGIKHLLKVGLFARKESRFPLHPPRGRREITSINFMLQNGEISDIKLAAGIYVLELRLQTSELGSLKQVLQIGKQLRPTFCKIPDLPP